jgi:hypothetical protein
VRRVESMGDGSAKEEVALPDEDTFGMPAGGQTSWTQAVARPSHKTQAGPPGPRPGLPLLPGGFDLLPRDRTRRRKQRDDVAYRPRG